MPVKTPADRAVADVERAIQAHQKATEKHDAASAKADEAFAAAKRAERELKWRANHPDLPDDFDLAEFKASLEAPFDEGGDGGFGEPDDAPSPNLDEEVDGPTLEDVVGPAADVAELDEPFGDDDDPFADVA